MTSSYSVTPFRIRLAALLLVAMLASPSLENASAFQNRRRAKRTTQATAKPGKNAVIKGKITYAKDQRQSHLGDTLEIDFTQITARLRQYVDLPAPKFPAGYVNWTVEQKVKWERDFVNSEAGKRHIERNKKLLAEANSFDIKFDKEGSFVVYDVPAGDYAIQGLADKVIGRITYRFEVYGQLKVQPKVDELVLAPIQVEVTPRLKQGDAAPPLNVKTHDNQATLKRETFKDAILLINFWSMASPTAAVEQQRVQRVYQSLKEKYNIRLLSINVDENRKQAIQFLLKNQLREGSHGFTDGMTHPTLFNFGIRGVPSYWLLSKDNKILMSQFEFGQAMRVSSDMAKIAIDRIEGKDAPTLAPQQTPAKQTPATPKKSAEK